MQLRRATKDDFDVCKSLWDDIDNDMLYRGSSNAEELSEQDIPMESNLLEGIWDEPVFQQEMVLTPERYQNFFDDSYGRAYVFEDDDDDVIGFITLYKISRFRWKLATISVIEEFQTLEVLTQIVKELNAEKQLVSIEVCVPLLEVQKFFEQAGFNRTGFTGWFKKTRRT